MWAVVLLGAAGCYATKLLGYLLPERLLRHPLVNRITALIPIALLSALVVVLTFTSESGPVVDARLAGVAAAAVLLLLRAPFLVVVFGAAAVAALLRFAAG